MLKYSNKGVIMKSMTGYGRAEYKDNFIEILVEIRSVNNRNLDINAKMPRVLVAFEDAVRKCIQAKLLRGRVDVFVSFKDNREKAAELSVDYALAESYLTAAKQLSERFSLENDYTVSTLMKLPEIVKDTGAFEDYSEFEAPLVQAANAALDALNVMRAAEGEKLVRDIESRMETIRATVDEIALRAPAVKEDYAKKLKERISEAMQGVGYDEARLLNEVAFFADKSNIDEEITRLYSHISQFYRLTKKDGAGKQLDFLIQEFNREANTICSKANDIEVTNCGLKLKGEIEKIREQVQNIE